MDVVLQSLGEIEIDHTLNVLHINATRCHISGDHDGVPPTPEFFQDPIALALFLVAVNGECRPPGHAQVADQLVATTLGFAEDEDLALAVVKALQLLHELVALLHVTDHQNVLGHGLAGMEPLGTNLDLDMALEEVPGQALDLPGPRSAPHERLAIRTNLTHDFPQLGLEPHVQHAVSLIEDKVGNAPEVRDAGLEHVDQTAWGGNDDLHTALQITDLRALGNTAVHARVLNLGVVPELRAHLLDLHRQLAGWCKHQNNGAIAGLEERLGVDVDDCRQQEREGLPTTGLRQPNDVLAGQSHGPAVRLDCRWFRKALAEDVLQDVVRKGRLLKGHNRFGYALPFHSHLLLLTERLDFRIGAGGHVGMLVIKILLENGKRGRIPILLFQAASETAVGEPAAPAVATASVAATTIAAAPTAVAATTIAATSAVTTIPPRHVTAPPVRARGVVAVTTSSSVVSPVRHTLPQLSFLLFFLPTPTKPN
mmetsp:Transcript_13095/g.37147  ORF Transcript_13095/g.37147 Transcript_13095/m.37147 type:complete len:482 (-) Transcript_13095:60-1505(-)